MGHDEIVRVLSSWPAATGRRSRSGIIVSVSARVAFLLCRRFLPANSSGSLPRSDRKLTGNTLVGTIERVPFEYSTVRPDFDLFHT